jgi:tetratricopeptide (TPR) repeat protein
MTDAGDEYRLLAVKVALAEGRHSEALELLDDIPAESSEEEAHKLVLAGQAFEGLNDAARARDAYQRAQSLAPGLPTSILREGVLRYHRGDRAGARLLLHRYVDVEPGNPEAFYYLALCEDAPERQADVVRKLAVLDGRTAPWSRELLRSQTG